MPKSPNNIILKIGDFFEKKLNNFNFLKSFNQYVLFDLKKK